ncbi:MULTISPECIES: spore-associated protein A [unclassified Micromonospora]|uniref:spore-associated protein A n=1 Tax=unclassified Micromonospora TaxID=2617518 RepID=UPI001045C87E|nr:MULTISPECIES: spore-associated protein A [unclassified Micromonospora]TDB82732.1 spore-associated protein A [Micromonospora sp. KC721]TDC39573.1 spore-associated protein A [Micromonospora sp. KC213]
MKLVKTAAATVACTATMVAGALAVATPAYAATYAGECGSGYGVVNSAAIGSKGTVFLTYSASTGRNCVIAKRNSAGSAVLIEAGLAVSPVGTHWTAFDGGHYTSYAGPIYLSAADKCVDWMGRISGTEGGKRRTNCG